MGRGEANYNYARGTQDSSETLTAAQKAVTAQVLSKALNATRMTGQPLAVDTNLELGARDSGHQVFFLRTPRTEEPGGGLSVACKRFERHESAVRELQAIKVAQERGFKTLQPAGEGVYPVEGVGHMLVTERMPRLTTMNYSGWSDVYAGQPGYERRIASPLKRIGAFAARMHSSGILHKDFKVKNIAQDGMGNFILFDLENTEFVEPGAINDIDFVGGAGDDMKELLTSLVNQGYLWSSTDATFAAEVDSSLMTPYLECVSMAQPSIENVELLGYLGQAVDEAMAWRPQVRAEFSSQTYQPA